MKKTIKLVIEGNEYFTDFPTAGQLMDIESLKYAYTNQSYATLAASGLKSAEFVMDLADTISFFSVLFPALKEDLGVKNWSQLEALQSKKLIKIYKKEFKPWLDQLLIELYKMDEEESKPVTEE